MKKALVCIISLCLFLFAYSQDMQWEEVKFTSGDGYADIYGSAVSVDGEYMVIGDHQDTEGDGTEGGAISIYKRNSSSPKDWTLLKKITGSSYAHLGQDVEIVGDLIFVLSGQSSIKIYQKDLGGTDNWGLMKTITTSGLGKDNFGTCISATSTVLAVQGVDYDGVERVYIDGVIFIFRKDEGGTDNWGHHQTIAAPDSDDDGFGNSLSVSGLYLVVGNPTHAHTTGSNRGKAYLYNGSTGTFNTLSIEEFSLGSPSNDDYFGQSVSMGSLKCAISATGKDDGAVYVYARTLGNWGVQKIISKSGVNGDQFGNDVCMDGTLLIVGADHFYDGVNFSGKAFVYEKDYGGTNNWGEKDVLTPSTVEASGWFGCSVDINGDTLFIGAYGQNKAYCFYPDDPDTQASSITTSELTDTTITFNWTNGSGDYRAAFIKADGADTPEPEAYKSYTANTEYALGEQIGTSGWYCVYSGNASHTSGITVTGLSTATNYRIMVCEYNFGSGEEIYTTETATDNPLDIRTWEDLSEVDIHVANEQLLNTTANMEYEINGSSTWISCTEGTTENVAYEASGSICYLYVRDKEYPSNEVYHEATQYEAPSFSIDYVEEYTQENAGTDIEYTFTSGFESDVYTGDGSPIFFTPGTDENLFIRYAATQYDLPSEVQTLVIPDRPAAPTYTIDYINEQTNESIPSTVKYATNSIFTQNVNTGAGVQIAVTPGTDLYFRVMASQANENFDGYAQQLVVDNRPAAPTSPVVNDVDNTFGWTITAGFENAEEYEYTLNAGTNWTGCTVNPVFVDDIDIATGDVLVRVAASNDSEVFYGESLASDADFTAPTTWNGSEWTNGSPLPTQNVFITNNFSSSGAFECNNLTVSPNINFTASHTITINGDLQLNSDATGTASILGNEYVTINGTTTVQNYMEDYGAKALFWHYTSIPVDVSGGLVTSNVFGTPYNNSGTDYYAFYYDETITDYVGITDNTTVLSEQMRGYAIPKNSAETLQFSGNLIDGTQTIDLTRSNTGYNLIGNPYPSGLDLGNIDAGLTGITPTNLTTTIWIRVNGAFNEYNWQSGTAVSGTFVGVLPPMQAAWVRVTDGQTTGSLQFENTARVHNNEIVYKATESNILRFNLSNGQTTDNAVIGLYQNATSGLDNYDSEKMFSDDAEPQVFMTIDDTQCAINGLPASGDSYTIPVGIKTAVDGNYTISFSNITEFDGSYHVFLEDSQSGDLIDLRKQNEYEFYADATESNSRFSVIITKSTNDIVEISSEFNISYFNNSITINAAYGTNATVTVYDISGKIALTQNINLVEGLNRIEFSQPDGVYLVNIRNNQLNFTEKIAIR